MPVTRREENSLKDILELKDRTFPRACDLPEDRGQGEHRSVGTSVSLQEPPKKRALLDHQILVLCRDDKEVVVGVGQSASVHLVESSFMSRRDAWKICIARLRMPADVPLLEPNEAGLSLHLVGTLMAAGLMYTGCGSGFTVDGHNMVIYELAEFLTWTKPAILEEGPKP
jgi:hypothetical protein